MQEMVKQWIEENKFQDAVQKPTLTDPQRDLMYGIGDSRPTQEANDEKQPRYRLLTTEQWINYHESKLPFDVSKMDGADSLLYQGGVHMNFLLQLISIICLTQHHLKFWSNALEN